MRGPVAVAPAMAPSSSCGQRPRQQSRRIAPAVGLLLLLLLCGAPRLTLARQLQQQPDDAGVTREADGGGAAVEGGGGTSGVVFPQVVGGSVAPIKRYVDRLVLSCWVGPGRCSVWIFSR